jgi:hypothetical protein
MDLDVKKVGKGSLIFVGLGVVLVILSLILQILPLVIPESYSDIVLLISVGYQLLLIPVFLVLFFIAGVRGVKIHKLDAIGAGAISALSYFIVALIHLFFSTILNSLVLSGLIPGGAGYGSSEAVLATALFGDVAGAMGIGASLLCGVGSILIGSVINFVVGGFGGLFAQR